MLEAVHYFFAQRIFGQHRQRYLRARLAETIGAPVESLADVHKTKIAAEITDLQRRQDNLLMQLEEYEPTGETDIDREYRAGIQRRFAELVTKRREAQARLAQLTTRAQPPGDDIALLGEIPQLPLKLGQLPEELQRQLYDAFQLQIRYNKPRHDALIRVTIREDTVHTLNAATSATSSPANLRGRRSGEAGRSFPCSARLRQDSNLRHPL